jgi:hypothetical protein
MPTTGRHWIVPAESIRRFVVRDAFGRFWRSGFAPFSGIEIRLTNRDSEIQLLSEVGIFRVVAQNDLAEFAYNGDRNRVERDIEGLERQGLAEVKTILGIEQNPIEVVTLTKEGNKFLRQAGFWSLASAPITDSRNQTRLRTTPTCIASIIKG